MGSLDLLVLLLYSCYVFSDLVEAFIWILVVDSGIDLLAVIAKLLRTKLVDFSNVAMLAHSLVSELDMALIAAWSHGFTSILAVFDWAQIFNFVEVELHYWFAGRKELHTLLRNIWDLPGVFTMDICTLDNSQCSPGSAGIDSHCRTWSCTHCTQPEFGT